MALFNTGHAGPAEVAVKWGKIGLSGKCVVRDVLENKNLGTFDQGFASRLTPHGAGLYKITPQ